MDLEEMLAKAVAIKNGQVNEVDSLIRLIRAAQLESFGVGKDQMDQVLEALFPDNAPTQGI